MVYTASQYPEGMLHPNLRTKQREGVPLTQEIRSTKHSSTKSATTYFIFTLQKIQKAMSEDAIIEKKKEKEQVR